MSAICGLTGSNLSTPADPLSSSESKSPPQESLAVPTKMCNVCSANKPFGGFRKWKHSKDGYRKTCSNCLNVQERARRAAKPGRAARYAREFRENNPAAYAITRCFETARRKGLEFDLDKHKEELSARIIRGVCEVTGFPLDLSGPRKRHEKRPNAVSIDRKDCSKGYTIENVRVVCLAVNLAMNTWGEAAVMPILRAWTEKG